MIYFIERFRAEDIPFDGSVEACNIDDKIYDIVISNKDTKLIEIAEHVIDENTTFCKTNPRESQQIAKLLSERFDVHINNLLLG